jgi:hypothetical protein
MDPALKNLREWVVLLFLLFLALDIAAVEYGMQIARLSPDQPDLAAGNIAALIRGHRDARYFVYVTPRQLLAFFGLLAAAAVSLIAMLAVIVTHGVRRTRADRRRRSSR